MSFSRSPEFSKATPGSALLLLRSSNSHRSDCSLHPIYQKWYMDDGGIVGGPELLMKVWDILKVGGVPLGLVLNPKKCEWSGSALTANCRVPSMVSQSPRRTKFKFLVSPLVRRSSLKSMSRERE